MLPLIYVKIDRKEFARVRLGTASTAAELRNHLSKNYRLPLNTYFLDTEGYRVNKDDEEIDTVEQLLHVNKIIYMTTNEIIPKQKTSTGTANLSPERKEIIDKCNTFIITELFSVMKYLWRFSLKPMIVITLMYLLTYYGYTKLICRYGHFLPFVTVYCPIEHPEFISIPPLSKLADSSASLSETLMSTDVNAPMRFVQAKTSLIQLRTQVIYSHIDTNLKNKLSEQMLELQQLVQIGADQLTIMLASFGGSLDKLRIYTQFALEDLSEVINSPLRSRTNTLQIGYSGMQATDKLTKSYENYMTSISDQIDTILFKAQQASMSLETIKDKLETIHELNSKGKHISETRIDELKYGSFWSRLFDEGKLGIAKHERNLKILDGFIDFVKLASNNVNDVIFKLKIFKNDAEDLKVTGILLEQLPYTSVNRHTQLLQIALKRLAESKEKFEGKMQQANQQNEISQNRLLE